MGAVENILNKSLLLDLETAPDGKVLKVGAVLDSVERSLQGRFSKSDVVLILDELAQNADFVLGHNIRDHDLPILRKQFPFLNLHHLPVIDTLFLSPIAFPENPYHHLVKDYRLLSTALNNPVYDAKNAGQLFKDQWDVFQELKQKDMGLVQFYAWAFSKTMDTLFDALDIPLFSQAEAQDFFGHKAADYGCCHAASELASDLPKLDAREAAAYVVAWLRVAGANSIIPPWVRHRFPEVPKMIHRLRYQVCDDPSCPYCQTNHNPQAQLQRFFGFDDFRPEPKDMDGGSLQEAIVRAGMNDEPMLAILPTGGGKSLCYQLPALVRNLRQGVLSVVISPLQALMKDQVDNLNDNTESNFAAALYGMLTPPERGDVLERVRMGDIGILYVSPEQLRNASFRNVIKEREIGCWIFDEAHCLSRWGHSFRPDYLYASRFIRELAEQQGVPCPPVTCFTATAKRDVIEEICQHFEKELSQELRLFDGGAERVNLDFEVQVVSAFDKRDHVKELLQRRLPNPGDGASVVYCATRKNTEEMAEWLRRASMSAAAFHAGLETPEKRRIQDEFIAGTIQHICATNAFGMGIDKKNVRLVVHADIPGSLENYLQEAGRAGRDLKMAQCVLLYDKQDIETQFALSAFSRLTRYDIAQILKGIRRAKRDEQNAVVITAGEILRDEEVDTNFNTTDPTATTKINTAVSMLERGDFVQRNENKTNVLQVRPLVQSLEEAGRIIEKLNLSQRARRQWMEILNVIFNSGPNEGLSADELAELPSMATVAEETATYRPLQHDTLPVIRILNDMVNAQIVKKDALYSAFVKVRCPNAADKVFEKICLLEKAMVALMREEEPDAEGWLVIGLRRMNQRLVDEDFPCSPETIRTLLNSLAQDGQGLAGNRGSIDLKYLNKDHYRLKIQRSWDDLCKTMEKRQAVAGILLDMLVRKIPASSTGTHLVEFSENEMLDALKGDMFVAAQIKDFHAAIHRGLLFLYEQKAMILQNGLAVFRQAMTVKITAPNTRRFTIGDFSSLKEHYLERNFQIHVMNKYAHLGLEKITTALAMVTAYFTLGKTEFVKRYFAGEQEMLDRATSAESYQEIVDHLNNPIQVAVVSAKITDNMLVLAGPGSGKTRVIAHRCAYLLRVERVRPHEILVVCFNRSAAISLRQRIHALVGRDAARVTVQTYHGLAMRLIGASFSARLEGKGEMLDLDSMIPEAAKMLRGECEIPGVEPDEMRERLLAGYRHILIDEYQDIDEPQYDLVSAIAGRTLDSQNEDAKLSILAVGDDDQNIYTFRGANIQFIRQFEQDYSAHTHYLVENYRSTKNIIAAANQLIALNSDRMKTGHPIQINSARRSESVGSPVRIVACGNPLRQARFVLHTIKEIRQSSGIAVFSRTKDELHAIRAALEVAGIPSTMAADGKGNYPLHRMRESHALIMLIKGLQQATITATSLRERFRGLDCYQVENPWCRVLDDILSEWESETNNNDRIPFEVIDFIYDALHERQRDRVTNGGIYLSTVHAAKGLEFDHVILLGTWIGAKTKTDQEEERRLYYVGMTRARKSLVLCELDNTHNPHTENLAGKGIVREQAGSFSGPPDHELQVHYSLLDLSMVWIGYPATAPNARYVRQEVAALNPWTLVWLKESNTSDRVFITNKKGYKIGALSDDASKEWKPKLESIKEVRVHSIINWRKEFLDQDPPENCPDEWEVPLLEVVSSAAHRSVEQSVPNVVSR